MKKIILSVTMICVTIFSLVNCSKDKIEISDSAMTNSDLSKSAALVTATTQTVVFSGLTWNIKSGNGLGPGPNNWNASNVTVDDAGSLHLKITYSILAGKWECAEIWTQNSYGFGTYEWVVEGSLDFNKDVVLGLFNYLPSRNASKAAEIDIEFAKWGDPNRSDIGNYSVWPPKVISNGFHWNRKFVVSNTDPARSTKHMFTWTSRSVSFQSEYVGGPVINSNVYAPASPTKYIPQVAAPVRINFWLFQGQASTLSQNAPVEVVISSFRFTKL